jgi:hypothetical protein
MVANKKSRETEEKKGRVKVGKLKATKELSAEDAKKVKGGNIVGADKNKYMVVKLSEVT